MLKNRFFKKALLPTCIALATAASFVVISSTGGQSANNAKTPVQSTNITTLPINKVNHETRLKGYGEIVPAEITQLSTRVSGTVVYWSDKFIRGGVVKESEVLYRLEDSRYQAALKNAEAILLDAKAILERELGFSKVAKSELERINATDKNSLFLREPQINSAYAAVKSAEAQLVSANTNLASTIGKAPYDALVVERNIGLGQYVTEGTSIAVLYNVNKAEVVVPMAKFDSQFLPDTMADRTAKITLPNSTLAIDGQLSRQLKLTDSLTRTNSVIVTINDLYQHKQGGMSFQFGDYVQVEFAGKAIEDVYKIPESLVSNNQIWIVNEKNVFERREVSVLRNENGFALINGGFKPLDKLATSLPEYPYIGMPVKVIATNATDLLKGHL
jgi:multidrug efflux system membrane fusion protein